jgi:hypothetical protein
MFGMFSRNGNEINDESIARDLSHLQINTIIKSHISGGAMPAIRFALCDISSRYAIKLVELSSGSSTVLTDQPNLGGYKAFDHYQAIAKKLIMELEKSDTEDKQNLYMLQRIRSNSNRVKLMLHGDDAESQNELPRAQIAERMKKGLPDLPLAREDYSMVRKLWELGTEEVAMQTVLELDGDVVLRISPRYAGQNADAIHKLHNASVDLSYQYWNTIIKLVAQFIDTVFKSLFRNPPR